MTMEATVYIWCILFLKTVFCLEKKSCFFFHYYYCKVSSQKLSLIIEIFYTVHYFLTFLQKVCQIYKILSDLMTFHVL